MNHDETWLREDVGRLVGGLAGAAGAVSYPTKSFIYTGGGGLYMSVLVEMLSRSEGTVNLFSGNLRLMSMIARNVTEEAARELFKVMDGMRRPGSFLKLEAMMRLAEGRGVKMKTRVSAICENQNGYVYSYPCGKGELLFHCDDAGDILSTQMEQKTAPRVLDPERFLALLDWYDKWVVLPSRLEDL